MVSTKKQIELVTGDLLVGILLSAIRGLEMCHTKTFGGIFGGMWISLM